ncbi:hypothetical protein SAMD00019534_033490, partial [Acytostelium subglobosum LB1]|uniref:hypothetical protein n=1 Tax=Acytostelium subglobosum LB1 TaxID=1410327 RepID=UPI00064505BD
MAEPAAHRAKDRPVITFTRNNRNGKGSSGGANKPPAKDESMSEDDNNNNNGEEEDNDQSGIDEEAPTSTSSTISKRSSSGGGSKSSRRSTGGSTSTTATTRDEEMADEDSSKNGMVIEESDNNDESGGGAEQDDDLSKKRTECLGHMERIEKEFQELKERFFNERLSQIKKDIEDIKVGDHHGFQEKAKELEQKKDKKIKMAEGWMRFQIQNIDNIYDAEKQQFDNEYDDESLLLRERMVNSLFEKQRRISEEKEALRLTDDSKIVSKAKKLQNQNKIPKKQIPPSITYSLSESEVNEDFEAALMFKRPSS